LNLKTAENESWRNKLPAAVAEGPLIPACGSGRIPRLFNHILLLPTMTPNPFLRPAIGTAAILLIPLVMTFVDRAKLPGEGWRWGPLDFVVMGALLFGAGWVYEMLAARTPRLLHKAAICGAILLCVAMIWAELAVYAVSKGLKLLFG
jgi:hypothetical protein